MRDENKSVSSVASSGPLLDLDQDQFKPRDITLFSLFYPLFKQEKHPRSAWERIRYCVVTLELLTLAFFHVNPKTRLQTTLSKAINFVDLSSLQFILAENLSIVSVAISQFDCQTSANGTLYFRGTQMECFGSKPIPASIGFTMSIIFLIVYFALLVVYNLLIYQYNPKYGGLFSIPSPGFQLAESVFIFGVVFAMRTLIDWPFWRFAITVGVSIFLILWILIRQPFYHVMGNFLAIARWTLFGCVRACLELGYLISGFVHGTKADTIKLVITIVCGVLGICGSIGLSFVFYHVLKKRRRQLWLLSDDGMPLADVDDPLHNNLPKIKNFGQVEVGVRFIQEKEYKSCDYLSYVDLIYTSALKQHKSVAILHFHYANFLTHFRKNHVKAQSVFRTARRSNPSWPLRFVLFCQSKEQSTLSGIGNEIANAQLQSEMGKAAEMHETAKNTLRHFFSNLTSPKPKLEIIPILLHMIVENEGKARKIYEGLLNTHPQSTQLLRDYASLLLDIFNDEDMADVILTRADQIEENWTGPVEAGSGTEGQRERGKLKDGEENGLGVDGMQKEGVFGDEDEEKHRSQASRKSNQKKEMEMKRKRKKKADTLITDISGHNVDNLIVTGARMCSQITLLHVLFVGAMIAGLVVYLQMSKHYSTDLSTLRSITRLAEYTGRTATYGLMFIVHELQYGFTYSVPADGKSAAVFEEDEVRAGLIEGGKYMTQMTQSIFDLTDFTEVWVSPDVELYEFTMHITTNPHKTGVPEIDDLPAQPMVKTQTRTNINLLSALTSLAQKSGEMGSCELVEKENTNRKSVTYPTFTSDAVFIVANSPQTIMNGLKRAIFAYSDETAQSANTMISVFLIIVLGMGALVASWLLLTYIIFTRRMMVTRKRALMDMLEVPKPKLQSVIRRLIEKEDTLDGTGSASVESSVSEDGDEGEDEVDEEGGDDENKSEWKKVEAKEEKKEHSRNTSSNSGHPINSIFLPEDMSKPLVNGLGEINPTHSQHLSTFSIPSDFRLLPSPTQPLSPFPFQSMDFEPLTPMLPGQTQQLSLLDSRRNSFPFVTQDVQIGLQPMSGGRFHSLPQVSNSLLTPPILSPHRGTNLSQAGPILGFTPRRSSLNLNMGSLMTNEMREREEQKRKKEEERRKRKEEEEKKQKAEEKARKEEESKKMKDEQTALLASGKASDSQKGFLRKVINDEKWEEKLTVDIDTLTITHSSLPSPLSKSMLACISLNMLLGLASILSLAVLAIVLVTRYKRTNYNITVSGMRTSILALVEFLNLRLLFPFANICPTDANITFDRSTNPVFKGYEHLTIDKDQIYALLAKSSNYFQQLHSATHYGESVYALTNDSYYDDFDMTRLSTEDNEKTLLRQNMCFMETSEQGTCADENRIFNIKFPQYGLASLIARMRLYVWLMATERLDDYSDHHPIPRYIASACRYDLRSGMNKLTNEILESSQRMILMSQTIITIVTAVCSLMILVSLLFTALKWLDMVMQNLIESQKLLSLLPTSRDEKEIQLLPSMMTMYRPLDEGRMRIIDAVLSVVESIDENEKKESLNQNLDFLMITTTQVFADEEADMEKRDYEAIDAHKRDHRLLRQRLTRLSDEINLNQVASTRVARRYLVRLFDSHFIDDDVAFGNSIPTREKVLVEQGSMVIYGDEENDVKELREIE
ncbi:hypothetical protein BLNAU_1428 [Blattamonas nauphoetae]|uniref:TmcB/TmcC TPR repeats domain-containing protein n=1 Tax=Blattamonas nauphoetae TaxID=2049346 RepID=A0ABQ9YHZ6_9EUKA|nr:hypothetical protein BLNAU_1428 [Blattamonas nauphoetae]